MKKLLVILIALASYFYSTSSLLATNGLKERSASTTAIRWEINPTALKIIAGEFKGVVSTFITLEVSAYLGTELIITKDGKSKVLEKTIDWDYAERLFCLSMAIDPRFVQTYTVSQGHLPWEAGRVGVQNKLLAMAAEKRFWDWRPLHYTAFNNYYFLNDYGLAGKMMIKAGTKQNAPPFLPILGARLAQRGGSSKAALLLMKSMLVNKDSSDPDYIQLKNRYEALQGVVILDTAIKKFRSIYQTDPKNLEELASSHILENLPPNPYNVKYCLDGEGQVQYDIPDCR